MKEYTIRIDDDGVRSTHDKLIQKATHASRAQKWSGDCIECEGPDDDLSALLAYIVREESR